MNINKNNFHNKRKSNCFYRQALDRKEANYLADIEAQLNKEKAEKLATLEAKLAWLYERTDPLFIESKLVTSLQYVACALDTQSLSIRQYDRYRENNNLDNRFHPGFVVAAWLESWPAAMRKASLELPELE